MAYIVRRIALIIIGGDKMHYRERWDKKQVGLHSIGIYMDTPEGIEARERDYMLDFAAYCSQSNGDCDTCSLVNYGLDCHNSPINPARIVDSDDVGRYGED
jgi:hypothetical protein